MCSNRYKVKGEKGCQIKHIDGKVLYQNFTNTFNAKDYFTEKWRDGLRSDNVLVIYKSKQFIKIIEKIEPIKEFDVNLFLWIMEKMTVFEGEKVIVILLDGTEIEAVIE
ncbi:MAG: recombinase [Bacillota bacterium]|nr:recombinase [Bacillota bacterium]